jgi:hypothetical protein
LTLFSGNHFVALEGIGFVRIISSGNFRCDTIAPQAKIGFVYKLSNAEAKFQILKKLYFL